MQIPLSLSFLIAGALAATSAGTLAQSTDLTVRSAKFIAPNELGASMYTNNNYALYFKPGSMTMETVTPLVAAELSAVENAVILSFDEEEGFPPAVGSVSPEGKVITEPGSFTAAGATDGAVTSIKSDSKWLPTVQVAWAEYDKTTKTLESSSGTPGGVYLVKDREVGDLVASGKQGLIASPAATANGTTGGILFTPDTSVGGFGLVVNNQCESYPGYTVVIAAYDEADTLLFTYEIGVARGKAVYFGAKTNVPVKKIWAGQLYGMDGTVIDDVTFIPVSK